MSKYQEMQTVLTEERLLVEALLSMGYTPEVPSEGACLYGYEGTARSERAHVIIPRRQLDSASNDIGFSRDASGVYRAIISEYDESIGFDRAWLGRVSQHYKELHTIAVAKVRGYIFQGREVFNTPQGSKVQLRFLVR